MSIPPFHRSVPTVDECGMCLREWLLWWNKVSRMDGKVFLLLFNKCETRHIWKMVELQQGFTGLYCYTDELVFYFCQENK